VDDNVQLLDVIGTALEDRDYRVTKTSSGQNAIQMLLNRHFDMVITDLNIDTVSGFDVLKKSKEMSPDTPVMIITASNNTDVYDGATRLEADELMWKPFSLREFWNCVAYWMEKSEKKAAM
jgi:DNA-binding NtrC family response regulator